MGFFAAKLQAPRRVRGVIARPRLNRLLGESRDRLLTVIKAPPGSGKTTLALAWSDELAATGARVAWLSIGPEDDEPDRFLLYVAAALHRAHADVGKVSEDIGNAPLMSAALVTATLVNELAGQQEEIFLFLDDYHLIASEAIHDHVNQLLRHAPDGFHLIILGRSEPALALAPYRARDELLEIDASVLRFDVEETTQLVRKGGHAEVSAEGVWALNAFTDGWIAALRGVMLSLRGQRDIEQYLHRLSAGSRPVTALFAELLDGMPAEQADFMMRIAVAERISGTLAEALTGRNDGQAMLDQIERQQLFLAMLDEDGLWFSFHPLFREYLQRRLQGCLGSELPELHRRAARWHANRGLWADAVKHALAAGDSRLALEWVDQCAMRLVEGGDVFTLLSWERQLHAYVLQSPSRLRLALAWGLAFGMANDEASRLLGGVEAELEDQPASVAMHMECRALRAMMIALGDDCETAGKLARDCLDAGLLDGFVRNVLLSILAASHLDARRWEALYALPPATPGEGGGGRYPVSFTYRLCFRGAAEIGQGHLEVAKDCLTEALRLGRAVHGRVSVLTALPAGFLAEVLYEQNRLDEAFRLNAEHLPVMKTVASFRSVIGCYRVALAQARADRDELRLRGVLEEIDRLCTTRRWYRVEAAMLLERVLMCIQDGRGVEGRPCLQRLEALAAETGSQAGHARVEIARYADLARAWMRVHEGACASAIGDLEPHWKRLRAIGHPVEAMRVGTTLALAYQGNGSIELADETFLEVCRLAAQTGAERPILDQPLPVTELLSRTRGRMPEDLASLAARLTQAIASARTASEQPAGGPADVLSPRERHILKLVVEGKSNKEIAGALGIGAETVKTHLKNIYTKLKVENRAQAAACARSVVQLE